MSGGSGLRRFVAGADPSGNVGAGADAARAQVRAQEGTADANATAAALHEHPETADANATAAALHEHPETADANATAAALHEHPETADARATLEAALGRPLESVGQPAAGTGTDEIEKCELCSTVVPAEHGHLADLETSSLMCACRACYLLFTRSEAVRGRYRAIPDRYLTDPEHPISTADWEALEIPVGLAFFLNDSRTGHVTGFYPSPAGATECRLDLQAWNELASTHPLLTAAEPDVEAILVSRPDPRAQTRTVDSFIVPIDACYELAGRMRLYWRGFDGGSEAKASITEFLDKVQSRARVLSQGA
jgi:hypothetical protein